MENKTAEQNSNFIPHICEKCETEYLGNFCPNCGNPRNKPPSTSDHSSDPTLLNDNNQVAEKNSHFFLKFVLFLLSIALLGFIIYAISLSIYSSNSDANKSNGNISPTLTIKSAPTVEANESLADIVFNVSCPNHNYRYVIIEFTLLDKNGDALVSRTLRKDDLKKGGSYQLKYTPSFQEIFATRSMQYRIKDYK